MNTFAKIVAAPILLTALSSTAIAEGDAGKFSISAKVGQTQLDAAESNDPSIKIEVDGGTSVGFGLGYNFNDVIALEFDYVKGEYKSTIEGAVFANNKITDEGDTTSMALFATFRSTGKFYGLGKIGYGSSDLGDDESESGVGYGIGAGIRFTDLISLEAEYTILTEKVGVLGASLRFSF